MIPYILSENPGIDSNEAFALSKNLMDGNKMGGVCAGLILFGLGVLASVD